MGASPLWSTPPDPIDEVLRTGPLCDENPSVCSQFTDRFVSDHHELLGAWTRLQPDMLHELAVSVDDDSIAQHFAITNFKRAIALRSGKPTSFTIDKIVLLAALNSTKVVQHNKAHNLRMVYVLTYDHPMLMSIRISS